MADFKFSVTLVDAYERESTKRYEVSAADFAAAQAAVAAYLDDLKNVTEARIVRSVVSQATAFADTVDAGANIDEGVTMVFLKADGFKATTKIPAPLNAILLADGGVDTSLLLVTDWADHFLGGPIYVSDGEIASTLESGSLDR